MTWYPSRPRHRRPPPPRCARHAHARRRRRCTVSSRKVRTRRAHGGPTGYRGDGRAVAARRRIAARDRRLTQRRCGAGSTIVLPYYNTASLPHYLTALCLPTLLPLPPHCLTALLPYHRIALLPYRLIALLPYHLIALPPHCLTALPPYHLTALPSQMCREEHAMLRWLQDLQLPTLEPLLGPAVAATATLGEVANPAPSPSLTSLQPQPHPWPCPHTFSLITPVRTPRAYSAAATQWHAHSPASVHMPSTRISTTGV